MKKCSIILWICIKIRNIYVCILFQFHREFGFSLSSRNSLWAKTSNAYILLHLQHLKTSWNTHLKGREQGLGLLLVLQYFCEIMNCSPALERSLISESSFFMDESWMKVTVIRITAESSASIFKDVNNPILFLSQLFERAFSLGFVSISPTAGFTSLVTRNSIE